MDNETEEAQEKVSIMTLHAAKGLEFPVVFLPGWEDGLFPSQRSMDESGKKGLEEERRLAYVGITRAEELCTISFASNRRVYGQWQSQLPSRFIDELPSKHVEVLTPPGLYGGGYGAAAPSYGSSIEDRATKADVYNSPGWRRMQDRVVRPVAQPREARNMVIDAVARVGLWHRRPGVPPEVRLWRDHGHRRRQAGHRVRPGRVEEDRRALGHAGASGGRRAVLTPQVPRFLCEKSRLSTAALRQAVFGQVNQRRARASRPTMTSPAISPQNAAPMPKAATPEAVTARVMVAAKRVGGAA